MSSSTDSGHWSEYESKAGSEIGCKAASNTQEPGYALTEREVNNKVVELMAEDCKLEACIEKFFYHATRLPGKKVTGSPWLAADDSKDGEFSVDKQQLDLLEAELVADIDSLLPDFFASKFPDAASKNEKRNCIESRIERCWGHMVSRRELLSPSAEAAEVRQKLLEALPGPEYEPTEAVDEGVEGDGSVSPSNRNSVSYLKKLRLMVQDNQSKAFFTCGGSITIAQPDECRELLRQSPPVALQWSSQSDTLHKTILPEDSSESTLSPFQQLVRDCTPATFGLGQKDVLDPSYRLAGKLDSDCFLTSFHPADFGILDSIEQTLLPSISSKQENNLEFRRVKAELYKLNVYSGPSGLFRAHVDTPRSQSQFGSLVVCLPSFHQGGTLIVRHQDQSQEYAWDRQSSSHIQWAAFYSDCEHEIERVTEGHRVTLTYNLYVTEPIGGTLFPSPLVDPHSLPIYGHMKSLLTQPDFLKNGGILGFYCCHYYPHTNKDAKALLPRKLKGSDMALYASLATLGLWVKVLPVLNEELGKHDWEMDDDASRDIREFRRLGYVTRTAYDEDNARARYRPEQRLEVRYRTGLSLRYYHLLQNDEDISDIHKRWKLLYKSRLPAGSRWSSYKMAQAVGTGLHQKTHNDWDESSVYGDMQKKWPGVWLSGITWVNRRNRDNSEEAMTRLAYGNNASLDLTYSDAAILAIVPPWDQRNSEKTPTGTQEGI